MPEREEPYSIRFVGANPDSLDAQDLIQVLSAFRRISLKASLVTHGSGSEASFRISHVNRGSIDIQGFVELIAGLQPAFAHMATLSLGIADVPELIKTWLDLLKFLKGEPPKVVQTVTSGNAIQIDNLNGDSQVVNGNVYNTFIFNNIGRDAAKLELPTKHGAKHLELLRGKRKIATYDSTDLSHFRAIKPAAEPIESEIEAILEVIAPVFEGDGVWRFKYGRMSMTAKILDDSYRQQVVDGQESFRHGDRLKVRLKTVQERVGDKIVTKHFITEVIGRV
jgi:hypothetical protein